MIDKYFILCTASEFEKAPGIDPARADLDWIEVTREEWERINDNRSWQAIDNPDHGKQTGTRKAWRPGPEGAVEEFDEPTLDTRRRIIVPREPDPPTAAEVEAQRRAAIVAEIRAAYSVDDEAKLINAAVEAIADGCAPPKEYCEYRNRVAAIKAKHPKEAA